MLSANDQEIAERVFKDAEAAAGAEAREPINKALTALERVAGQLTAAMMSPATESTPQSAEIPPKGITEF
jgi:hypothetical protein